MKRTLTNLCQPAGLLVPSTCGCAWTVATLAARGSSGTAYPAASPPTGTPSGRRWSAAARCWDARPSPQLACPWPVLRPFSQTLLTDITPSLPRSFDGPCMELSAWCVVVMPPTAAGATPWEAAQTPSPPRRTHADDYKLEGASGDDASGKVDSLNLEVGAVATGWAAARPTDTRGHLLIKPSLPAHAPGSTRTCSAISWRGSRRILRRGSPTLTSTSRHRWARLGQPLWQLGLPLR